MNIGSMMGGGKPTTEMIQQMHQRMFTKLDSNTDGGIDSSELTQFGKDNGLDTSKIDELFKSADTDGSGTIDQTEHSAIMDQIGEKMKGMLGTPPGGGSDSTNSTSDDTNDVLMEMMDKIREHAQQQGGMASLRQFLSDLTQQNGSYNEQGTKSKSESSSVLLTQLA